MTCSEVVSAGKRHLPARPFIRLRSFLCRPSVAKVQLAAGSRRRGALGIAAPSSLDLVHTKCRPYFHARDPRLNFASVFRAPESRSPYYNIIIYMYQVRRDTGPGPGGCKGNKAAGLIPVHRTVLHTSTFISCVVLWRVSDLPFRCVSNYAPRPARCQLLITH